MLIYRGSFSVFSTYVEVILFEAIEYFTQTSILHVCGGHPVSRIIIQTDEEYSPRMWRSSWTV